MEANSCIINQAGIKIHFLRCCILLPIYYIIISCFLTFSLCCGGGGGREFQIVVAALHLRVGHPSVVTAGVAQVDGTESIIYNTSISAA